MPAVVGGEFLIDSINCAYYFGLLKTEGKRDRILKGISITIN